jgi:hypothetical protein
MDYEVFSDSVVKAMAETWSEGEMAAFFSPRGLARHTLWECDDGWIVGYTTERIKGGSGDGKFAAMAYKPVGKGARSGDPSEHEMNYWRLFSTRKAARARADKMYDQHNAKAQAAK